MLFYISLLEQIGDSIRDVQLGNVACHAVVSRVQSLLAEGQVQKAFEVADCAFEFINRQGAYHHLQNISTGFKLSALMAERAGNDQKLQEQMSELSRKIIRGVLQACKESKIDFVRLQLEELNELVALLGMQQNYTDLESLVTLPSLTDKTYTDLIPVDPRTPLEIPRSPKELGRPHHHRHRPPPHLRPLPQPLPPPRRHRPRRRYLLQHAPHLGLLGSGNPQHGKLAR
ncbi:MAG: hypothetical protein Q9183_007858 [Haloplaca sp. 2 TL-2023]